MTGVFTPHLDILPPVQRQLWPELRPTRDLGLVLYGGTAIALQLGHRSSIDFDFFTNRPFTQDALESALPFLTRSIVLQDQPNTLTVQVPSGDNFDDVVNVSFFGGLTIGRVGEPRTTDDDIVQVASLDDLLATKVKVLLQRVEAKDYQDVAALVTAGVSLARALAAARTMYGHAFQPSEALKALVYFEGGDLHTLSTDTRETLVRATNAVDDLPHVERASSSLSVSTAGF